MPKTVMIFREADGGYACFSCAEAPVQSVPSTGQETGIDLRIEAFATLSDGTRITILSFKAACAARRVIAVTLAFTSQPCSGPGCGVSLRRDHNAALNILALGKQASEARQASQARTWADRPSVA